MEAPRGLEPRTFWLLAVGFSQLGHADLQRGGHAFHLTMGTHGGIVHRCHWCAPVPWITVLPRGLEPRTLRLLAVRSDQLSYETLWERQEGFCVTMSNIEALRRLEPGTL